eukprot:3273468-Prymnesium_polylepis.1
MSRTVEEATLLVPDASQGRAIEARGHDHLQMHRLLLRRGDLHPRRIGPMARSARRSRPWTRRRACWLPR